MAVGGGALKRRTQVCLAAALTVTSGGGSFAGIGAPATAAARSGCSHVHHVGPGWSLIDAPPTPTDPTGVSARPNGILNETIVGQDPRVLLATDGAGVYRTADGGCTWSTVYSVPTGDHYQAGVGAYTVVRIVTAAGSQPTGRQTVYLTL